MTTIFPKNINDSYLLEPLTYDSETKIFKKSTELVIGRMLTSSAQKSQSTILLLKAFISIRHQKT